MNNTKPLPSLAFCIIMDLIGYASFTIPFIGDFSDIIWAPISGIIFYNTFGGKMGLFGGLFDFLEELLPFTDIIPTFTIAWYLRSKAISKEAPKTIMIEERPKQKRIPFFQ